MIRPLRAVPATVPPRPAPFDRRGFRGRRPRIPVGATALGWLAWADSELVAHSVRTAKIAATLCRHLGWSEVAADELERAALFHDIGKTLLPHALLSKPGPLTVEERELVRRHTTWGASLLAALDETPALSREVALHHHERWDGAGYPDGQAGADIPEAARIVAVADAYDALTADRTYRQPIPPRAALDRLRVDSGGQFDPTAFAVLETIVAADGSVPTC